MAGGAHSFEKCGQHRIDRLNAEAEAVGNIDCRVSIREQLEHRPFYRSDLQHHRASPSGRRTSASNSTFRILTTLLAAGSTICSTPTIGDKVPKAGASHI